MSRAFEYGDGFWYDSGAGYYYGSTHFQRWGWTKTERLQQYQWVGSASINSLAEDLGLVKITHYSAIPFVVDDFGNLRRGGQLGYWERQWQYPEEWLDGDSDER